jgi:hypothetical protein
VESVQLVADDHQFVVAEFEFAGTLARHPVPLSASLAAELARPSRPGACREHPSAPSATSATIGVILVGPFRSPTTGRFGD